eukprot:1044924-Pelagomonas_calceolata.AAC.1
MVPFPKVYSNYLIDLGSGNAADMVILPCPFRSTGLAPGVGSPHRPSHWKAGGRLQELEARIAQASGELELARHTRTALEQRLMGAKTRAEVDELIRRLDAAEQLATQRFNDHANLTHRAE